MKRKTKKTRRFPIETLSTDEAKNLIRQCSRRAPTGIRNAALLSVLYRCGLRIAEALALKHSDIDADARTVRVLFGKGAKARTVGIDDGALAVLQRWIDKKKSLGINGRTRLFCTLAGDPMSSDYIRTMIPRLARKAGIEKRVHAHALRHTFAAELARENTPINVIQVLLGHSSSATTARYIDHIAQVEGIEAIASRTWALL